MSKKPAKSGLDYVRGNNWKPVQYTLKGAQRQADRYAKQSGMHGAVGVVCDCGEYYRLNVAAQPFGK